MSDMIVLKIDKARQLLAAARDATDAKKIADIASAAEVYAKRQRLSQDVIDYASTVKIDALTLMGQMLQVEVKNKGGQGRKGGGTCGSKKEPQVGLPPTREELFGKGGKKVAFQAQQLARLKETAPATHEKVRTNKLTVAKALSEVRKAKKRKDLERKAKEAKQNQQATSSQQWKIIEGDCRANIDLAEKARLIFADPPYNIGVDYGGGKKQDQLTDDAFLQFCSEWVAVSHARLTDDGSLWVLIGDEYAAEIGCLLKKHAFTIRRWVKWYETFGVNCSGNFNRCSRHLFYCVKDPKRFVFHADAVTRPSARQVVYHDGRAEEGGKLWDDVWIIPRLCGTTAERIPDFPTQLPLELLRPIIGCTSYPGDLVMVYVAPSASVPSARGCPLK